MVQTEGLATYDYICIYIYIYIYVHIHMIWPVADPHCECRNRGTMHQNMLQLVLFQHIRTYVCMYMHIYIYIYIK